MTTPARLLDFFILEAGDYLMRLETIVTKNSLQPSDATQFAAAARGLRGSATMAKASGISKLALTVERIASSVAQGAIAWEPELQRALVGAIDDLKLVVRGVRDWSAEQDARVEESLKRLSRYAPSRDEKREDVILPISQLFFNDTGQHIVQVAANPKTNYEQQLREQAGVGRGTLSPTVERIPTPPRPTADRVPTPSRPATPQHGRAAAPGTTPPRGQELRDVLKSSLATMQGLENRRSGPHPVSGEPVPIQQLLYRGQRAIERAAEIRRALNKSGTAPTRALVDELVDLVELATPE
jgi:chemotaxis protein histidine kinase CheA